MEDLIEEVKSQVLAKAVKENRNDFENIFKEVMNNRHSFYVKFFENFNMNVTNIQHALNKAS